MEILVGKTAGFCYGVQRAYKGSLKQIKNNNNNTIYCLGELVHNKQVVLELQEKGINFIDDLEEVEEKNANVIVRAHGVTKEVIEHSKNSGINIIDYTCPKVLKTHLIAEEYSKKGFYIILCGKKDHPEIIGTKSYCGNNFYIIENEEEIEDALKEFRKSETRNILILAQTTYSLKKFEIIQNKIKEKAGKNIEVVVNNTICKATKLRQKETQKLSQKVDCMIIIGGKNSSNTNKLYEIAKKNCKHTIHIETAEEIRNQNIKYYNTIGVMAGASTPKKAICDVLKEIGAKTETTTSKETIFRVIKELEDMECMSKI